MRSADDLSSLCLPLSLAPAKHGGDMGETRPTENMWNQCTTQRIEGAGSSQKEMRVRALNAFPLCLPKRGTGGKERRHMHITPGLSNVIL